MGEDRDLPEVIMDADVILKRFEHPDELRVLRKGRFEIVRLGGMTIGLSLIHI